MFLVPVKYSSVRLKSRLFVVKKIVCFWRFTNVFTRAITISAFAWLIHWLPAKACHHRKYSYKNPLSSMLICGCYANIAPTLMSIYSQQQFFQFCKMSQHQTRAISLIFEIKPAKFQHSFLSIGRKRILKKNHF